MTSAQPVTATPEQLTWDYAVGPTTPAYFVQQGYGIVDVDAKARALDTLLGAGGGVAHAGHLGLGRDELALSALDPARVLPRILAPDLIGR